MEAEMDFNIADGVRRRQQQLVAERQKMLAEAFASMESGKCEWALLTTNADGSALLCSDASAVNLLGDALFTIVSVQTQQAGYGKNTTTIH